LTVLRPVIRYEIESPLCLSAPAPHRCGRAGDLPKNISPSTRLAASIGRSESNPAQTPHPLSAVLARASASWRPSITPSDKRAAY